MTQTTVKLTPRDIQQINQFIFNMVDQCWGQCEDIQELELHRMKDTHFNRISKVLSSSHQRQVISVSGSASKERELIRFRLPSGTGTLARYFNGTYRVVFPCGSVYRSNNRGECSFSHKVPDIEATAEMEMPQAHLSRPQTAE